MRGASPLGGPVEEDVSVLLALADVLAVPQAAPLADSTRAHDEAQEALVLAYVAAQRTTVVSQACQSA